MTASMGGRPLSGLIVERTPQRIERGRYLVDNVAHCLMCHSETEWTREGAGQPKPGLRGAGKTWEDYQGGPFLVSPNITSDRETGAGEWSDEMLARAIREGIGHDGRPLFFMPWENFRSLSDEDLFSVIAYIRTLEPVKKARPKMEVPAPILASLKPQPLNGPVPAVDLSNQVERGKYLVEIGQCAGCHSAYDEASAAPLAGMTFGGGLPLKGNWGEVTTPNLTKDPSGLAHYDEAIFVRTIREGKLVAKELNPVMPWGYFRNMSDEDLKAVFAYLRTVPPVKHHVDNREPPTDCAVCKGKHGGGHTN